MLFAFDGNMRKMIQVEGGGRGREMSISHRHLHSTSGVRPTRNFVFFIIFLELTTVLIRFLSTWQVVPKLFCGNLNDLCTKHRSHDGINSKAIFRNHYIGFWGKKNMPHPLDQFIRSVCQNEVLCRYWNIFRQFALQIKGISIWVPSAKKKCAFNGAWSKVGEVP